jgi:hypothetical protein
MFGIPPGHIHHFFYPPKTLHPMLHQTTEVMSHCRFLIISRINSVQTRQLHVQAYMADVLLTVCSSCIQQFQSTTQLDLTEIGSGMRYKGCNAIWPPYLCRVHAEQLGINPLQSSGLANPCRLGSFLPKSFWLPCQQHAPVQLCRQPH